MMKMAKADPAEVEALREFMATLEEMMNEKEENYHDIGEWVCDNFPQWRRTIEGYPILVENACDPTLSYLDWKPELKQLLQTVEETPDPPPDAATPVDNRGQGVKARWG